MNVKFGNLVWFVIWYLMRKVLHVYLKLLIFLYTKTWFCQNQNFQINFSYQVQNKKPNPKTINKTIMI